MNLIGHPQACRCQQCQVLAVFEDETKTIAPEEALEALIPLTSAFLSSFDPRVAEACIELLRSSSLAMRKQASLIEQPAVGNT